MSLIRFFEAWESREATRHYLALPVSSGHEVTDRQFVSRSVRWCMCIYLSVYVCKVCTHCVFIYGLIFVKLTVYYRDVINSTLHAAVICVKHRDNIALFICRHFKVTVEQILGFVWHSSNPLPQKENKYLVNDIKKLFFLNTFSCQESDEIMLKFYVTFLDIYF